MSKRCSPLTVEAPKRPRLKAVGTAANAAANAAATAANAARVAMDMASRADIASRWTAAAKIQRVYRMHMSQTALRFRRYRNATKRAFMKLKRQYAIDGATVVA